MSPAFEGSIDDYYQVARRMIARPPVAYARYRCVMTGWDNSARWGRRARIVINEDVETYRTWLRFAAEESPDTETPVFIFAWNEWAEGAYLEPDEKNGDAYLRATRDALCVTRIHAKAGNASARSRSPLGPPK